MLSPPLGRRTEPEALKFRVEGLTRPPCKPALVNVQAGGFMVTFLRIVRMSKQDLAIETCE